jgi:uncharacterized protein (DUF1778 family)
MAKSITFRLDDGIAMVIEAAAKQRNQSVSMWVRDAVQERIRDHVQRRTLDRMDERIYQLTKDAKDIKATLAKLQEAMENIEFVDE